METRERYRYREPERRDDELDDAIRAQQRFGRVLIASIGPAPDDELPQPSPSMKMATTSEVDWMVAPKTLPNSRTQTTW